MPERDIISECMGHMYVVLQLDARIGNLYLLKLSESLVQTQRPRHYRTSYGN